MNPEWAKDLAWLLAIAIALMAYGAAAGIPWPIAVVSSYSMEPTLRVGDFVVLASARGCGVSPGDIVVYVAQNPLWAGSWIIHRVAAEASGCRLVTWGDNNPLPDQAVGEPAVGQGNLVGKVGVAIPYVGIFPLVLRPQGAGPLAVLAWLGRLAVFAALTYAFYLYFARGRREDRGRRREGRIGEGRRRRPRGSGEKGGEGGRRGRR